MQYNYHDFEKFHKGMMDKPEAARFLEWLETSDGEETFHKWVGQEWGLDNPNILSKNKSYSRPAIGKQFFIGQYVRKIAAAVLILFTTVSVFYLNINSDLPSEYQTNLEPKEIVKSTPKGKKTTVTLSDGSKVYLNSESSISYLSNFIEERKIFLTGEAFFEVFTDSTRPFTVITKDLSTVALGTSFNINAYQEKKEILVSLASGKIIVESLKSDSEKLFVNPGEGVGYGFESRLLKKKTIDIDKITQWKSGILQFDDLPLDEVLLTLERWYGVEIKLDKGKKLPKHNCTGNFRSNEYLTNVLQALSHSIDFDYTIENKIVVLNFK